MKQTCDMPFLGRRPTDYCTTLYERFQECRFENAWSRQGPYHKLKLEHLNLLVSLSASKMGDSL